MKIIRQNNRIGFKDFSEKNGLELKIITREEDSHSYGKYCVSWTGVSIVKTNFTESCVGDGNSEKEAVNNYIEKIRGQFIQVLNTSFVKVKEVTVPFGLYDDFESDELN